MMWDMAKWITMPDGRSVNFDQVRRTVQGGKALIISYADGAEERVDYANAGAASTALSALNSELGSEVGGGFSLTMLDHENVELGMLNVQVLVGIGFSNDVDGSSIFRGVITIGANTLDSVGSPDVISYIDDRTLMLSWTPAGPADTYDLVYGGPTNGSATLTAAVTEA